MLTLSAYTIILIFYSFNLHITQSISLYLFPPRPPRLVRFFKSFILQSKRTNMSVDYFWFFIHLSSEEETKILPIYQDALQKAVLSDSSKDILQKWRIIATIIEII